MAKRSEVHIKLERKESTNISQDNKPGLPNVHVFYDTDTKLLEIYDDEDSSGEVMVYDLMGRKLVSSSQLNVILQLNINLSDSTIGVICLEGEEWHGEGLFEI